MGRRAAVVLFITALAAAATGAGLLTYVYRRAQHSVDQLLTRRLQAVGTTTARLLAAVPLADRDRALADLAAANDLDGAYLFDGGFQLLADAHGHAGHRLNLLKIDVDRARAALGGRASVGPGFDVESAQFLSGYFPLAASGPPVALALEAGESFAAPSRHLRAAGIGAFIVGGALAALALAALALAVGAARRERDAYADRERAALASRMAAMVAHEVRNPLGTIRGGVELLRERAAGDPAACELYDDILGEVARINALTEEFLTLARDAPLAYGRVDVGELAAQVREAVQLRYREATLSIAADGAGAIEADAEQLRRALYNLVLNAVQATDGRGPVWLEAERDPAGISLVVSDSGPGVPSGLRRDLFAPFATGKPSGNGLGLAVARRVFERHGGKLELTPSAAGARFSAWIPGAPARAPAR